jgi:hypothetical protein
VSARLATARAALRAHLSPVMSRDHETRDRLCAEVDAAVNAERVECETVIVMTLVAMLDWLACPGASPCWCDHCLTAAAARRIIDAMAVTP